LVCDGVPSAEALAGWHRTYAQESVASHVVRHVLVFTDPKSGLELKYSAVVYSEYAVVELLLELHTTGLVDSPLLEQIRPLDCLFTVPRWPCTIHHALGESNSERSFMPVAEEVEAEKVQSLTFAPRGGRSSDEHMPFFNMQWAGGGAVVAIGWAGQWSAQFRCEEGNRLRADCGMEKTHLRLHPGEAIRTPRVLVQFWRGEDDLRGNNLFRQWMLAHNLARRDGELVLAPICGSVTEVDPDGSYEGPHVRAMEPLARRGVEVFWSDMDPQQWYPRGFPEGTGTWEPDIEKYPRGLRPIGEAAHAAGLEYLLWFEPERVASGTRIEELHPEWITKGQPFHLFRLDIPEARAWLTDYVDQQIREADLDWLRWDFNIEPLTFWQRNDTPDRAGITEIRHIEGLYAMWEELERRHPGLLIDNCSSGGRRLDIEAARYGLPLWHSDMHCVERNVSTGDQLQNAGLNRWVPFHGCANFGFEPSYAFRSAMTAGNILISGLAPGEEEAVKRTVALYQELRPYMLGDFYPLFPHSDSDDAWFGYQFHRPETSDGFVMVFRRTQSPAASNSVRLRGVKCDLWYCIRVDGCPNPRRLRGLQLEDLPVNIVECPGTSLIRYAPAKREAEG